MKNKIFLTNMFFLILTILLLHTENLSFRRKFLTNHPQRNLYCCISKVFWEKGFSQKRNLFGQVKVNYEKFQKDCEKILGQNRGAILVFDISTGHPVAVVNPEIAFKKVYRPGSLYKLVTSASLLENGSIDPETIVKCRNFFNFRGTGLTCSKPGGHGNINLSQALGYSCSEYFYRTASHLTYQKIRKTSSALGFGKAFRSQGVEIEAVPGVCNPPDDPRKFIRFVVGDDDGIMVTPWQVANLVAIIATKKPLSSELALPKMKPVTWKVLREGMEIAALEGTCKKIGKSGIDAVAKTGTATNRFNPNKYHGWFAGYLPHKNPKYVVVVFLEDGRGYLEALDIGIEIIKKLVKIKQRR